MVILADQTHEIGEIKKANISMDLTDKMEFSVKIARKYWDKDLFFGSRVYIPGTEFGGLVGAVNTDTALDYNTISGDTWRGILNKSIILPPAGEDYLTVSGEIHQILRELLKGRKLFRVSDQDTKTSTTFQFDRYCTVYDGIVKLLKSVNYKLRLTYKNVRESIGYVLVEAVPILDLSNEIEMSQDTNLLFRLKEKRNGINHLICLGKGELRDRTVLHLYVQRDGTIGQEPYFTGDEEYTDKFDYPNAESLEELKEKGKERLLEEMNAKKFSMDLKDFNLKAEIGDIVGGRDYQTGLYASKPIGNILYKQVKGVESYEYKLEGAKK